MGGPDWENRKTAVWKACCLSRPAVFAVVYTLIHKMVRFLVREQLRPIRRCTIQIITYPDKGKVFI